MSANGKTILAVELNRLGRWLDEASRRVAGVLDGSRDEQLCALAELSAAACSFYWFPRLAMTLEAVTVIFPETNPYRMDVLRTLQDTFLELRAEAEGLAS